jgi:hypothetical protein
VHNDRVINIGQAESAHNRGIDTGQAESAKHNQVQVCSNVEHGRVIEYVQHSQNNIVESGRAGEVSIDADGVLSNEVPRGYSCNYLTIRSASKRLSLDEQLNTDWSRTIFNPSECFNAITIKWPSRVWYTDIFECRYYFHDYG